MSYEFLVRAEHDVEQYLENKVVFLDSLPWILCSTILWGVLFKVNNYDKEDQYTTSTQHALLLGGLGLFNLCVGHGDYEPFAFYVLTGYFVADFFMFCLQPEFYVYILHHVLTIGASYRMINGRNWNDSLFASSCWLVELSTPFLNLYQLRPTAFHGAAFVSSFFLLRVVWLSYLSYQGWNMAVYRYEVGLMALFLGLNYYWFFDIVRQAWEVRTQALKKQAEELMHSENIQHLKDQVEVGKEALKHRAEELLHNIEAKKENLLQIKEKVEVGATELLHNIEAKKDELLHNFHDRI